MSLLAIKMDLERKAEKDFRLSMEKHLSNKLKDEQNAVKQCRDVLGVHLHLNNLEGELTTLKTKFQGAYLGLTSGAPPDAKALIERGKNGREK